MQYSFSSWRKYIGLALISASVLGLQVTFTRIFSLIIWYHFTYLIVGVALLGGGAAGTFLVVRQWDGSKLAERISKIALLYSVSVVISLLVINIAHFDPLTRSEWLTTIIGLGLYFVSLFGVFFLGGLAVAGIFTLDAGRAHRLYFADLLGASAGTLLVTLVIQTLNGTGAIVLIALLALIAAWLLNERLSARWRQVIVAGIIIESIMLVVVAFISPIQLPIPRSKELGLILQEGVIGSPEYTRWNPVARVDVLPEYEFVEPPLVGGLSSTFTSQLANNPDASKYPIRLVTLDGTSMTGIHKFTGDLTKFDFLEYAVIAAPFIVSQERPRTLNIGVGGGIDILLARLYGAAEITAIDINADLVELLKGPYASYSGRLADDPKINILTAEGRGFLMRGTTRYDIIQGIGLDNFAALSGGAYVLSESYIYTVEAFEIAISRLSEQGIFSWTRSVTDPPREMLRLTGLAAEALRRADIENPGAHIAIVANEEQSSATLLVSRTPFTAGQMERLRTWAESNHFPLFHDPLERKDTVYADYLLTPDPRAFEADYPFNIYPVTDDNPYFYNYFRWTDLSFGRDESKGDINLRFPIGNIILLVMFTLSVITAVIFIILPLARFQRRGIQTPNVLQILAYFSLLGVGYITIEVVLIQRFTLFIGYPTQAITITIFSMLFFSAMGSLAAQQICTSASRLKQVMLLLVSTIVLYILGLPALLQALQQLSDPLRLGGSIIMIAPLAFLLGMPFPTGIRQLHQGGSGIVAWAWGMNGVFSVIGSVLVIIVSMLTSFTVALAMTSVMYAIAAILSGSLWRGKELASG